METVLTHNGYIAEGIEAKDDSYNIWQAEYTRHINELHMAELARTLMYQGGVEDREEFGENSEAPTDFDPYAGDPWTTYNISAPAEDILKSLMEK